MYFAVDPHDVTSPSHIAQELVALRHNAVDTPFHVFALIDGAFDETILTGPDRLHGHRYSLYANTALQALETAAPHLVAIPTEEKAQLRWLQKLFARCQGIPMFSIIASTLDASALEMHLRPYLIAITSDTLEWPIRWADTRVLPALMAALTENQRIHFLAPLFHWWSPQRDGVLLRWNGSTTQAQHSAGFDKLPLDDNAFFALVDAAEADAILANIFDSQPELLRRYSPAQCHARVNQHLELARRHGIDAAISRQHFCVLALLLPDDVLQYSEMNNLLQRTREGDDYQKQIAALPASFWQDISVAATTSR